MNICIATSTFPSGPDDRMRAPFLRDAIVYLQRSGHEVSVLTQARAANPQPPLAGLDVTWFHWKQVPGRLAELSFRSPAAARSAASLIWSGTRAVRERRLRGVDIFLCAWVVPSGIY